MQVWRITTHVSHLFHFIWFYCVLCKVFFLVVHFHLYNLWSFLDNKWWCDNNVPLNVWFLTIIYLHYWDELLELDCLFLEASCARNRFTAKSLNILKNIIKMKTLTRHIACIATTTTTTYLLTTNYHQLVVTVVSLETNHCLVSTNSVCDQAINFYLWSSKSQAKALHTWKKINWSSRAAGGYSRQVKPGPSKDQCPVLGMQKPEL